MHQKDGETVAELYKAADSALYIAKIIREKINWPKIFKEKKMRYTGFVISVKDINASKKFYEELFDLVSLSGLWNKYYV